MSVQLFDDRCVTTALTLDDSYLQHPPAVYAELRRHGAVYRVRARRLINDPRLKKNRPYRTARSSRP